MENPFDIFEQIYESHDNGEISDEEMVFLCESAEEKLMLVQENFFGIGGAVETRGKQLVDKMVKDICEYASKTLKAGKDVTIGPIADIIKSIGAKIVDTIGNIDINVYSNGHPTITGYFRELPGKMEPYIEKSNSAESYAAKYAPIKDGAGVVKQDIMRLSKKVATKYAEFFKDHKDSNGKQLGDTITKIVNQHVDKYKKDSKPEKSGGQESLKNSIHNVKSGMKMVRGIVKDTKSALEPNPRKTLKGIPNLHVPEDYTRKELQVPKMKMGSGGKTEISVPDPRDDSYKHKNTERKKTLEKLATKLGKRANSERNRGENWLDVGGFSIYHHGKFNPD